MRNKHLGILALIGSPWLFIGPYVEQRISDLSDSWFTGVWGILFISGWLCSVIGLKRLRATKGTAFGKAVVIALIIFLTIANVSNGIQLIVGSNKPSYFIFFDVFWPLSNVTMLVLGIIVIVIKGLPAWKRYIPFATGIWFPLAMASLSIEHPSVSLFLGGIYSALAWGLLAVVVMTTKEEAIHRPMHKS